MLKYARRRCSLRSRRRTATSSPAWGRTGPLFSGPVTTAGGVTRTATKLKSTGATPSCASPMGRFTREGTAKAGGSALRRNSAVSALETIICPQRTDVWRECNASRIGDEASTSSPCTRRSRSSELDTSSDGPSTVNTCQPEARRTSGCQARHHGERGELGELCGPLPGREGRHQVRADDQHDIGRLAQHASPQRSTVSML